MVYNDEFSSRLSVASIMRLRADALMALGADTKKPESTAQPCPGGQEPVVVYIGDSGSSSSHHSSQSTAELLELPMSLAKGYPWLLRNSQIEEKGVGFQTCLKAGFSYVHTPASVY